ncbi:hypothetical protein OV207_12875 [Corallococcus sp. BB11-1]|uniref:hypothetical protein n=1 Tax=Corallococcus sp. BB11-1 TaxID=2996783 RepID=UPI002270F682|nr:hypothetical protein [Corallococcus sp. BB11-1]MCY1032357.1 hypothetical protein [Corallococcus sp. BB11-1]
MKTHPTAPERCGATKLEAEEILFAAKAAAELAKPDLPEWKNYCLGEYVECQEKGWRSPCYECFRYFEGQQGEWPHDRCSPQRKG